jgi:hypothetical protein
VGQRPIELGGEFASSGLSMAARYFGNDVKTREIREKRLSRQPIRLIGDEPLASIQLLDKPGGPDNRWQERISQGDFDG